MSKVWVLCGGSMCVLCVAELFVSDPFSSLSTPIAPASECKAIAGSCDECGPWMTYQPLSVRLSLKWPPDVLHGSSSCLCVCVSVACLCASFLFPFWFLRWHFSEVNCLWWIGIWDHPTAWWKLRIQSLSDQVTQACLAANWASLQFLGY